MPWLKTGDNAATHPIVMRVVALVRSLTDHVLERDVAVNEVFGFVMRCALQSAGHTTDYVIDEGTAWMLGGPRTERLLELARKAGYVQRVKVAGVPAWQLVDDPEFIHMRLKAEIDWERQQREDSANPALTVPVRLRDGDACRYCRCVVSWKARKGGRRGTYDHRVPGQAATVDTLVIACGACNAGRRDREDADDRYPLQPVPLQPLYSAATAAWLATHGHQVPACEDLRPGSQPDTATRSGTQPDTAAPTRPGAQPGTAAPSTTSDTPGGNGSPATTRRNGSPAPTATRRPAGHRGSADHLPTRSGSAGSGRVGTGRSPAPPPPTKPTDPLTAPKRATRGRPRTRGAT